MTFISKHWALKESISIKEAAIIICGHDPIDYDKLEQRDWAEVTIVANALENEIRNSLSWITDDDSLLVKYGIDEDYFDFKELGWETLIYQKGAKEWAENKGYEWPIKLKEVAAGKSFDISKYPNELRAAIDAFEELYNSKGSNSPKQRLINWLEKNKSNYGELSAKAIDRISTVANWKSEGGTPTAGG